MPVYLFTYHAYGSWLPDRPQGYVVRKQGILPQDCNLAVKYRNRMNEAEKTFSPQIQQTIINTVIHSQTKQTFECYFIATESTHVHVLLGWRDERKTLRMRATIKSSLTRALKKEFGQFDWLSEGGSRSQVSEEEHFEYLMNVYLPKHRGWKWNSERGCYL